MGPVSRAAMRGCIGGEGDERESAAADKNRRTAFVWAIRLAVQASQSIGKYSLILVSMVLMHAGSSRAQSAPTASPKANFPALAPGTTIDASNAGSFVQYLPAAAQAAINHGLKLQVVPTKRLDWSAGFTEATEKYSSQVGLDAEDSITNYVAGAPFPTVALSDPKAAVKIAYNWHMGPFMPDDFSLAPWGSLRTQTPEATRFSRMKWTTSASSSLSCGLRIAPK